MIDLDKIVHFLRDYQLALVKHGDHVDDRTDSKIAEIEEQIIALINSEDIPLENARRAIRQVMNVHENHLFPDNHLVLDMAIDTLEQLQEDGFT